MSKRVAVRNNGDSVEKFAFLAPLASAATGALAAGKAALATGAGKALVGGLAFGAGKRMASNAFKDQQKESESFTDKVKSRGEKAAEAGAAYAQAQQASQQQMEQRGQQMADKAKAGSQITTGEPMDMAWRMLKGELQLPHQITEALRGDLTTLDRAHKMTDTNEGTLIEGIHPDMEQVVKLLAEKHMGNLTPTKQRPIMPLFYGPHH
jgi:hypothetical protein